MKKLVILLALILITGHAFSQSFILPGDGNWYRVATMGGFVFKPAYSLPTLTAVKTYIDLNHHLPDMPSEKEVADKRLDLGEMNKLLLKKVEELTLYLLKKDEQIGNLEKRMRKLEKQHKQF